MSTLLLGADGGGNASATAIYLMNAWYGDDNLLHLRFSKPVTVVAPNDIALTTVNFYASDQQFVNWIYQSGDGTTELIYRYDAVAPRTVFLGETLSTDVDGASNQLCAVGNEAELVNTYTFFPVENRCTTPLVGPYVFDMTSGVDSTIVLPDTDADSVWYVIAINGDTGTVSLPSGWASVASSNPFRVIYKLVSTTSSPPAWPLSGANYQGWMAFTINATRVGGTNPFGLSVATYSASNTTKVGGTITIDYPDVLQLIVGASRQTGDAAETFDYDDSFSIPVSETYPIIGAHGASPAGGFNLGAAVRVLDPQNLHGRNRTVYFDTNNAAFFHAMGVLYFRPLG